MKPQFWQIPTPNDATLLRLPEKTAQLVLRLQDIVSQHQNIKFASSLAVEDMVITDVIAQQCLPITVFTLQTGRLNAETLQLINQVKQNYPELNFEIYEPKAQAVAQYVQNHGENAFYDSVALRRECCHIRKIEPLNRALDEADAWLTGQRREQSVTRYELSLTEHDSTRNITKYNPIADWSEMDVWAYILKNNIIFNELYHQGYPSIGCEPCTMPVKRGEDIRSGRWWWESRDSKECGLHK
jgi:adenylylsulfate reductase, thioredoxin dependent